jgi:hypothetical protein
MCPEKIRPTTACSRPPTARFINHILPAKMPLIESSFAGPASADAEALERFKKFTPSNAEIFYNNSITCLSKHIAVKRKF